MNSSYINDDTFAPANSNLFSVSQSVFLLGKHLEEWVQDSAVSEAIARLNIESLSAKELNERIRPKVPIKTGGWWCRGVQWKSGDRASNWYGQAKPDKPHHPEGEKARKYLTGSGMEPDAIFLAMPDRDYWSKVFNDTSIPRHWAEGVKKAGAGLTIGLATIALTGVWNWGKNGNLAELVDQWAQRGTVHYINFDSDYAKKPECRSAILKFAKLLRDRGCQVFITTWSEEFKGMDDFIKANGSEEFLKAVENAPSLEIWEKQLKKLERQFKKDKQPLPQELGIEFAEELRDRLCYSDEHSSWMKYELDHKGVWGAVKEKYVFSVIQSLCKARGIIPNNSYRANVLGALETELYERKWLEQPTNELLPFEDGVLSIANNQLLQHSPGFRLTWSLPRSYCNATEDDAQWLKIDTWLDQMTEGNQNKKELLLCFAAACLRGMSDVQKFLMLTGPAGTGKGVKTRLITMLVGERNTWIGNLEDLTKADKVAELQGKRLAVFDDQEKYTGNLSNFRSLTGGGQISGRKLYQNAISFRFQGLVLISANQPCFPASGLSWLKRRILQEEFKYTPVTVNTDLEQELETELSAFTRYLLSIPVVRIKRVLKREGTGINGTFWSDRVRVDPMASWVNDCIIHDTEAEAAIGADRDEWKDKDYVAAISTLFGSYNNYCRRAGYSPKGKNNFSADLVELCREVLEWKDIAKIRSAAGTAIKGLRLRLETDADIPTIEDVLASDADSGQHDADLNVDLEPLPPKGYVDHVDLKPKLLEKVESEILPEEPISATDLTDLNDDSGKVLPPSQVSIVYTNDTEQEIQPTLRSASCQHSGQHGQHSSGERTFERGDRVVVGYSNMTLFIGAQGEVVDIWYLEGGKQEFGVKFDKPQHGIQQQSFPGSELMKL
jgi:putative DNA primase/helicase